jgi:hypothetical protein
MTIIETVNLSDAQLVAEVKRLVRCERGTIAELVVHLAEMDGRHIHLAAGFPSLYVYCVEELRLSEYEAYSRIEAARAGKAFPRIFRMLGEGTLSLTTVQLLARKLTAENQDELLSAAAGRSKRDVQELLARHFPQPDVPATIRKLPPPRSTVALPGAEALPVVVAPALSTPLSPSSAAPLALALPATAPNHRPAMTPLAPDRYLMAFTADTEMREMFDLAQDMLRHAIPRGATEEVMRRALKALVEELARQKFSATDKPRKIGGSAADSRHIPAAVKREVWIRDRGRCAFSARHGRRCNERGFVEFHHVEAYAKGGKPTVGNIQLRCRAHNAYEADLKFGPRQTRGMGMVEETRTTYRTATGTRSGPSTWPASRALSSTPSMGGHP